MKPDATRTLALALATALVALAPRAAAAGQLSARLDAIGAPRAPAYVRANEIADPEALTIAGAPDVQSAALGDARGIVLDPSVGHYLWAVDEAGTFHVAPYRRLAGGGENIGHPMLLGGRAARLAGELRLVKDSGKRAHWVLDNDSGRYVRPYGATMPAQMRAARALLRSIGVRDAAKRSLHLSLAIVAPIDDAELAQMKTRKPNEARGVARARRGKAYWPIPEKGAGGAHLPTSLGDDRARAKWARRAARTLGPRPRR